ncbi:MAG: LPXTG cell wall anchor domain-containing protein, partial [Bacteroidota bacterium]|nr:LPXTG cell wall anchor domain-containing protein [Bacteroidota bacterium]
MKKFIMFAFLGLLFMGVPAVVAAQGEDSLEFVIEEPTDTISIDNMDPVYYEDETTEESSNTLIFVIIGGLVVVVGGAAYYFTQKKKK